MSNLEIAERFAVLIEAKNLNGLQEMLADNFTTNGPATELNKQQVIGYLKTLFTAFPDMSFGFTDFEQKDYLVTCTIHQKGTHRGILDLGPFGLPVSLPPTGKAFALPANGFVFGVENDKIIFFGEGVSEGNGLAEILAQLGVKLT
jgi:predicted ester cyclase